MQCCDAACPVGADLEVAPFSSHLHDALGHVQHVLGGCPAQQNDEVGGYELHLPLDTRPIVIGYSSGATIVYAALAADAGQRLGGGVSLGFCPDLLIKKPFCAGHGGLTQQKQKQAPFGYVFDKRETVDAPWRILQGESDQVCDPKFAPDFAHGQKDSKAVMLPKVGHGFGVPKNWMAQYRESLVELVDASR